MGDSLLPQKSSPLKTVSSDVSHEVDEDGVENPLRDCIEETVEEIRGCYYSVRVKTRLELTLSS